MVITVAAEDGVRWRARGHLNACHFAGRRRDANGEIEGDASQLLCAGTGPV